MEEDKEYRCGSCDTMTVSMEVEWGRMMTRDYDELFHDYTCCRCGGTLSLEADRRSNHKEWGDTIYVEGGYDEAFTCFGCGDIASVKRERERILCDAGEECYMYECLKCGGTLLWSATKKGWNFREGDSVMMD